ncbi:hypothetical protein [uncultured Litoreibacter sp.]|uniref:hypothetical protein n=1 Tax=uncultured Litoreibacter sp. TaxID=1392394 RepID=UPI0026151CA7|nr:hypothetical protein [uncultured Litoreibacter sp.]
MKTLTTALGAALLTASATAGFAEMTTQDIKNGFKEHAALAQLHRWYQIYERPAGGIENALDILAEDVTVTSGLGTANGHDDYAARVSQLPDTWKNAHHVKSTEITHGEDGAMTLSAQITYQNEGMLEGGAIRQAELSYNIALSPTDTVLPVMSEVTITPISEGEPDAYSDAYADNRMLSLVHYWLALIEDPSRNPDPVREILADGFSLNFSSGAITDFEGFKAWLAGPGSQVAASTHLLEYFSASGPDADGLYSLSVDFDWHGLLPDGTELVAKTRHNWTATNDVTERFARIKSVDVEVLEPFRPKDG